MTLSVASDQKLQVAGIGQIQLKIGKGTLTIKNVFYCKDIPGIILSIGQMINQLIKITFCKNQFIIQQAGIDFYSFKRNARWFLHIKNDSYGINIKPLHAVNSSPVTSAKDNSVSQDMSSLWNQRMDIGVCHPCSISKSEHWPIKNKSQGIVERPGDVTVVDLIGPLPESLNNMKYILMIQDVFSTVVVAIPIVDKSEAKFKLQNWMNQFNNVTNNKIKILWHDNGTEFRNHTLEKFLGSKGIIHKFAIPYECHQNGRIKQMNQTISEMAQTMLNALKLPPFLWPWAYQHAVRIFNQSLHTNDGKTLFKLLGGKKPSLKLLQVFGATSFAYSHNFKKDFSARAITGYHLGIAEDSKGWLSWIPGKKNNTRTASVKFYEKTFYDPGKSHTWQVQSIQVANTFDRKMIDEIENQDRLITAISFEANPAMLLPTTYQGAVKSPNRKGWVEAINKEFASMIKEGVFENVDLKEALSEVPHM
ncbi:hypothetical protein O181_037609 [Austropuccinia psidii MF-1]|uniref:Integrase catalytic domain-containing protein n=1 Tax=Austropuccinia psidii MF-1 TaxID=1389203 RepID=A0A9Q3D6V8_9BASI|nr:hypothetical protein [Austropuccinia psidii MF-1]